MWILTQNGERILSTEAMDEIRVSDPAVGKTDYAVMLNRRIDGKPFCPGLLSPEREGSSGSSGNPSGAGKVHNV